MMNIVQACGVVAKSKGDALVVATMLSMFIFDRIEGADGKAAGVPLVVYDAAGRRVLQESAAAAVRTIDVGAWPAGLYLLDVGGAKRTIAVQR